MADNENTFLNADSIYEEVEGESGVKLTLEEDQQRNLIGIIKGRFAQAEEARHTDETRWLKAYEKELEHFTWKIRNKEIKSIFFGGGTPSLMQPFVVQGIIDKIASIGTISDSCEITLEANPTSFETDKFKQSIIDFTNLALL